MASAHPMCANPWPALISWRSPIHPIACAKLIACAVPMAYAAPMACVESMDCAQGISCANLIAGADPTAGADAWPALIPERAPTPWPAPWPLPGSWPAPMHPNRTRRPHVLSRSCGMRRPNAPADPTCPAHVAPMPLAPPSTLPGVLMLSNTPASHVFIRLCFSAVSCRSSWRLRPPSLFPRHRASPVREVYRHSLEPSTFATLALPRCFPYML